MDCERKDECANYSGECTNDDFCLCEDFEELTEEAKLYNTLYKTIDKLRDFNQEDLIKQIAKYEEREDEFRGKIAELKAQLPNVDKLRKECLQEVKKEMFGLFLPGDTVYVVDHNSTQIPCSYCAGTGKVLIKHATGEDYKDCQKCYGRKTVNEREPTVSKKTISWMELSISENGKSNGTVHFKNYDFTYNIIDLFATAEECQTYIDSKVKK